MEGLGGSRGGFLTMVMGVAAPCVSPPIAEFRRSSTPQNCYNLKRTFACTNLLPLSLASPDSSAEREASLSPRPHTSCSQDKSEPTTPLVSAHWERPKHPWELPGAPATRVRDWLVCPTSPRSLCMLLQCLWGTGDPDISGGHPHTCEDAWYPQGSQISPRETLTPLPSSERSHRTTGNSQHPKSHGCQSSSTPRGYHSHL